MKRILLDFESWLTRPRFRLGWVVINFLLVVLLVLMAVAVCSAREPAPLRPTNKKDAQIRLGYELFYDKGALSLEGTMSCASCHMGDKKHGWGDGRKIAVGAIGTTDSATGRLNTRNSKSLINVPEDRFLDYDGRVFGIYRQCFQAVVDRDVFNMPSIQAVVNRVNQNKRYQTLAKTAYNKPSVDERELRECMVAFILCIRWDDLPADRLANGQDVTLPASAVRGWVIFQKFCIACHQPENDWQDFQFHDIGIAARSRSTDKLLGVVTEKEADDFKARTCGLAGSPFNPPYMHDGSLATMKEVVDYFAMGGRYKIKGTNEPLRGRTIDPLVAKIHIPKSEDRADLLDFMNFGFQRPDEDDESKNYPDFPNPHVAAGKKGGK